MNVVRATSASHHKVVFFLPFKMLSFLKGFKVQNETCQHCCGMHACICCDFQLSFQKKETQGLAVLKLLLPASRLLLRIDKYCALHQMLVSFQDLIGIKGKRLSKVPGDDLLYFRLMFFFEKQAKNYFTVIAFCVNMHSIVCTDTRSKRP